MLRCQCIAMQCGWRRWRRWRQCSGDGGGSGGGIANFFFFSHWAANALNYLPIASCLAEMQKCQEKNTLKTFISLLMQLAKREFEHCPQKKDISLEMTSLKHNTWIQEILGTLQRRRKWSAPQSCLSHNCIATCLTIALSHLLFCCLPNNCIGDDCNPEVRQ